jgi:hypothetical protein
MRSHHAIIAIFAVFLIGLGARLFFLSASDADALAAKSSGMDVRQMHVDYANMKDLPAQKMRDMTVTFSEGD